jgi:hypothetical protein
MKIAYVLAGIITFTIASMYGCTELQVQYVPIDLSNRLHPKPLLPRISEAEVKCLDKEVYKKIVIKQRLIEESDLRCRNLVNSTKRSPTGE